MKTLFIIYTREEEAIGWARNLIEAIGVKEHMARDTITMTARSISNDIMMIMKSIR